MKRRTAREKALQALFQIDMSEADPETAIESVLEDEKGNQFLNNLVFGVVKNLDEIDTIIKGSLEKWTMDRLANVDRCLLRMAVYEMLFEEEIPHSVTIDEAIEISKIFGDEKSSGFINSILSKVKQSV